MQKFTLVVPVKSLDVAKSRLDVGTDRHALALAFAQDTLAAALNAKRVRQVLWSLQIRTSPQQPELVAPSYSPMKGTAT